MYDHFHGEIANLSPNQLVISAGGVGFALKISLNSYSAFKNKPSCIVWCHLSVSETAMILYGFSKVGEREAFLMLIGVTGVGCNTAITILSCMTHLEVARAAAQEDKAAFKAIKGIGEKLAAQIVLDLKGKFEDKFLEMTPTIASTLLTVPIERQEAIQAVTSLGFNKTSASKAVDAAMVAGETKIEDIIKHALKNIK